MPRSGRRGGPGTALGTDFQARLAAWFACAILAEEHASALWEWPETETFASVSAETDAHVDDLRVVNSGGCRAYIQAKSRVQLSVGETSPLAAALAQVVREHRDLDPPSPDDCTRLVLAAGPESSSRITQQLPRILRRVRGLSSDQSVADAASGVAEAEVLKVVSGHIRREWKTLAGSEPTDVELRGLLSRLHVSIHDLYNDGPAERQALAWLRSSILRDPAGARAVWHQLISLCAEFSIFQTGADRPLLHARLAALGVEMQAPASFRSDIDKLLLHARRTVDRLAEFAVISGDDGRPITIQRSTADELQSASSSSSIVVSGDPGVGKSATMFQLATRLRETDDVIAVASDMLAANSLGELRNEIGLEHDIVDVLRNWPGTRQGYLIVDALDAARGERTQHALVDLIRATASDADRWVVVASIRRFDLRYNQGLRAAFPSANASIPDEFQLPEFAALSHFNVPPFSDDELAQLEQSAPKLHSVIKGATPELTELVHTPFNLRLLAELVGLNLGQAELEPVRTQLELLHKYWEHRVLGTEAGGDVLEALLRVVCENMITTRTMRVDRAVLQRDPGYAAPLADLLSSRVLVEEESAGSVRREVLAFSHHVLFDYAVARLLFRGTNQSLLERTRDQPELLLVVRPSYDLHFRYLWELDDDRHAFWALTLDTANADGVPEVGKIIGPGVAAQRIGSPRDAADLLGALRQSPQQRSGAELALRHVVGARLAEGPLGDAIPLDRRNVWCEIARSLTEQLRDETAYPARNLLLELCAKPEHFDPTQLQNAGHASRNLLAWVLENQSGDRHVLRTAIQGVARTFLSEATHSELLLRRVLAADRLPEHGYLEMPALADEVTQLIPHAPALVRDIYGTAFDFEEESEERTLMLGGVLSLTSTRRQDYEMARYVLSEGFAQFLSAWPGEALSALSSIQRSYARRKLHSRDPGSALIEIDWDGEPVVIEEDGSYLWAPFGVGHKDEVKVLNQFEAWVIERVEAGGDTGALSVVELMRSEPRPASIWRSLIAAALRVPEAFSSALAPLVGSPHVLKSIELSSTVGDFLGAVFPSLPARERQRIEEAILSIPQELGEASGDDRRDAAGRGPNEHARDRLLGCLDPQALVTDAACERLAELRLADAIPDNLPPIGPVEISAAEWSEEDELVEQGVDLSVAPNGRLHQLQLPVRAFAKQHVNSRTSVAEVAAILPSLSDLWVALQTAESDGVAPAMAARAWGHASDAAEAVSRADGIAPNDEAIRLATAILLAAATHPLPHPREDLSQFDAFPSWTPPAPRVDAAGGLLWIASHPEGLSDDVLDAVAALSVDPAAEVRLQIAQGISLLSDSAPTLMWSIADSMLKDDVSMAVLAALLRSLQHMTLPDRAAQLESSARTLFARGGGDKPGAAGLRDLCVELLTDLYIWFSRDSAAGFVRETVFSDLPGSSGLAQSVVSRIRQPLKRGDIEEDEPHYAGIRTRAIEITSEMLTSAIAAMRALEDELQGKGEQPDETDPVLVAARETARVIDAISAEIYFASGAFDIKQGEVSEPDWVGLEEFYREVAPVLDLLSEVPYSGVIHHVLETLEFCVPVDARGVFLRVAITVRAGRAAGYEFSPLAATLVVRLVERYLAEYRTLLQQDEECRRALIEVLDTFVSAGWPDARRLTYGLQDIFR